MPHSYGNPYLLAALLSLKMPVNKDNTKRLAVNLPIDLYERLVVLAAKDRRTVSSWLRVAVEDRVIADEQKD